MSWPLVKLTEVAEVNPRCPKDIDEDQIVSFVAMASASEAGLLLGEEPKVLKDTKKGFTYFERGDVLLAKITPCFENGKTLRPYQIKNQVGFGSTEFHVVRANLDRLDPTYLFYLLWSDAFRFLGTNAMAGAAGQKRVGTPFLKQLEIPLPPLDEQKRIASILDKADAIRQKRKQAIDLADEFLRSVFLEMFGDPLDPNSKVMTLPMTEVFNITTGKLNSNAAVEGGQYPFFTCAKEIFAIDDYAFEQEALLLAGNNAQADYDVKHFSGKFNAYQRTYVLTLKDKQQSYPFYKFALEYQLKNLKRFSKGSNTKYITMEIMERTMLPVPSNTLQHEFVQKYSKKAELLKSYSLQANSLNSNFNSLSQKAFSGQL
ncbi:restriction endonuclease subunit S [Vibrio paucivorans]|uniref:Restriction endonuclease subunit S n=1 Tax=Vibrio paucivorans TaxID=2829489 RepID=A0A9X3HTK9_9VIBR|nr:restriction endonuclease subunit S [Vibrio paucivorans]MCW8335754.1 restriction endonuclease subunit S [Vibrio paucivorans]